MGQIVLYFRWIFWAFRNGSQVKRESRYYHFKKI